MTHFAIVMVVEADSADDVWETLTAGHLADTTVFVGEPWHVVPEGPGEPWFGTVECIDQHGKER